MSIQNFLHIYDIVDLRTKNVNLANAILSLSDKTFTRRSHFFHGRYENLYLSADRLPGLRPILTTALERAAPILDLAAEQLRLGFWLNIMNKGDVTSLHSHDDDDELLSAVYYLQVPEGSGVFRLHIANEIMDVKPLAGRLMFFDPSLAHEVGEHHSKTPRISIGINIGPATQEG